MADSIPICDVLSEAMEYMSKLGSNIKIRSESLKEKRIRKDKLRNTHAIHKAVEKVLLICDLSKKSIENVETGVKNLLVQMEKAGASFGPAPVTRQRSNSEINYEYFTYESRKLKIRNKVSLEHYTSVKVVSVALTESILEKYPVYHDCKLYRMRKNNIRNQLESKAENIGYTQHLETIGSPENTNVTKEKSLDEVDDNTSKHTEISDSHVNLNKDTSTNDALVDIKKPQNDCSLISDNNQALEPHFNDTEYQNNVNNTTQSKIVAEDDIVMITEIIKDDSDFKNRHKKKIKDRTKKFKHIQINNDSSSSDMEMIGNNKETLEKSEQLNSEEDKETLETIDKSAKDYQDNTPNAKENNKVIKPLIKCVSLSKLLKPDRVIDLDTDNTKSKEKDKENEKSRERHPKTKSKTEIKHKLLKRLETSDEEDEEEYWARKRKEIKNFKAKVFDINIERLPNLTPIFLASHNLRKITENGLVVCEDESYNNKTINSDVEPKSKKMKISRTVECSSKNVDLNQAKSALLNDSDSDNIEICWHKKTHKSAKHALLSDSDTEIQEVQKNTVSREKLSPIVIDTGNDNNDKIEKDQNSRTSENKSHCVIEDKNIEISRSSSENPEELHEQVNIVEDPKSLTGDSFADNKRDTEKNDETEKNEHCQLKNTIQDSNDECDDGTKSKKISQNKRETLINSQNYELDDEEKNYMVHSKHLQIADAKKENKKDKLIKKIKLRFPSKEACKKNELESKNSSVDETVHEVEQESNKSKASGEKDSISNKSEDVIVSEQEINNEMANLNEKKDKSSDYSNCKCGNEQEILQSVKSLSQSDMKTQNMEKQNNKNILKKSLLEDSDCDSHNIDTETENTEIAKNYLIESGSKEGTIIIEEDKTLNDKAVEGTKSKEIHKNLEEVKNTLLNESDSETDVNKDRSADCKQNTNKESGDDVTVQQSNNSPECRKRRSLSSKDNEIIKSSLLKDSSDDHSITPKKRKNDSGDSPPKSKRKHIMESMYAKKMLLTYSSSSDTEDEQLRNTLKEIKDYLLKGVSSDDESANKGKKDTAELDDEKVEESESKDDSTDSDQMLVKKVTKPKTIKNEDNSDMDSIDDSSKEPSSDNSCKNKMGRARITRDDSCSQNSELLDDKEINGLTNLKSLKKTHRRRKSTSTDRTLSKRSSRRQKMAKAGGLISNEGFLQAESSSDAVSLSGSEHADNADGADLEEMPRVKLSDINGDGIGHLAKDDLLGESDTSISHDEKRSSKREDDTDEENVKIKRRKAHAISSDSEVGSSQRKERVRLSDFEDTEDESSEPVKSKRKKKGSDSDGSAGSSMEDGKKKRRRIKTLDDSDGSGSDTENEGRNKHGRKNIRKVMSKNQLEEATKKAAREEKERIARIAERQKLYNNLEFDESGKPDEVILEKVVLDFDPETKEPLIQVDRGLVKKLKPHQANGIKFMWDACFESVKRIKKDRGSGCILAHCMGLGKTLQVVSLTHTLLTHCSLTGVNRVLVVCPLSTVLNWVNEFRMWLKHAEADFEVDVYELSKFKQNSERAFQLSQWFEHGGVCVLGYEMFRNLSADNVKKFKKKMLKNFQESLVDPGPDLVVCDEGHLLKNEKTSLSQSMNRVKTRRRIVLTGTPLQNNLKEYYCMVQFVKPNLLGKYNEYLNRFVNPITNGQYTDSTEHDIRVMKRRSHVLHKMLDGAVQRRDYGVLAPFLPPKHEYVLFITLTEVQIKLYQHYLDNYSRRPLPGKSSGFLFPDFQSLQRIWTHPLVLKYNSERYEIMQQKKREREEEDSEGSLVDFIDDDSTPDESSTEESSDDLSDVSDDSRKKSKKKKSAKKSKVKETKASTRRGTRANPIDVDEVEPLDTLEVKNENPTEWWMKLVSEEELEDMRNSSKLLLLFDILRQCEAIGDKLLVFSQSLYSLDLIEHFLCKVDEATQDGRVDEKLGGHIGTWSPGVDYFRLDGSTSCENRSIWCKNFNMEDNPRARLFLISTRAGGLGINLVAANRVVIFDVSWNPSHDVQSIFRVYRFGQKKPCYVYRFLAMGTMEEKIYERQVTKQAISKRVIDEQQIDRHYAENDLAELYKFEPRPPQPRPLPPLPKDRLFAEMLREHEAQIYKYHEHDSLLENKEEETLSEEERKAAWEDFENEKTRPPPQPLLSPYAMHNGMMPPGLLQAQQQQLMYAALATMVRKDMPNMSEQQIRDAVSLIYNANPTMYGGYDYGLMQKMGDIYKYGQPGMMNPGMLNAMNAAGGGVGGGGLAMGGASGLQYEPPWQRQQQHQQQMRLQQIMQQQQNSMGAKYYAGGLGSRDPMAMALQQQRARELMLRPRARGRPPHAAPAPPPAHLPPAAAAPAPTHSAADVVNLDSD